MTMILLPGHNGPRRVECSADCAAPKPSRCSASCSRQPQIIGSSVHAPERYFDRDPFFADDIFSA